MKPGFVAGGTGRDGSVWFAEALRHCGFDVSHEIAFTHRCQPDHPLAGRDGEVSCAAAAWIGEIPTTMPVLHLTRDPLHVIRSYLSLDTFGGRYRIAGPEDKNATHFKHERAMLDYNDDLFTKTVLYVIRWDDLWEQFKYRNPYMRWHIEDATPKRLQTAIRFLTGTNVSLELCESATRIGPMNTLEQRRIDMDVQVPSWSVEGVRDRLASVPMLEPIVNFKRKALGYV